MDKYIPHFDCRVFQVETIEDALENISERVEYTLRNSRMMFAQSMYSQKQLHKLSSYQAVAKVLEEKGIDYNTVVRIDNRLGTVLINKMVDCDITVNIKEVETIVKTKRNKCESMNLFTREVLDLKFN